MKEQIEDKVIEEMALDLCDKKTKVAIVIVSIDDEGKPRLARSSHYLKNLIEAGYRKQKEGEWIDLYKGEYANPIYTCSLCEKGTLLKPHINELGNMDMVQALSAFCPNCGASMKGGAE